MSTEKKVVSIDESRLAELLAKVEKLDKASAQRTAYNARRNAERNIILAKALKQGIVATEAEVQAEMKRMAGPKA